MYLVVESASLCIVYRLMFNSIFIPPTATRGRYEESRPITDNHPNRIDPLPSSDLLPRDRWHAVRRWQFFHHPSRNVLR